MKNRFQKISTKISVLFVVFFMMILVTQFSTDVSAARIKVSNDDTYYDYQGKPIPYPVWYPVLYFYAERQTLKQYPNKEYLCMQWQNTYSDGNGMHQIVLVDTDGSEITCAGGKHSWSSYGDVYADLYSYVARDRRVSLEASIVSYISVGFTYNMPYTEFNCTLGIAPSRIKNGEYIGTDVFKNARCCSVCGSIEVSEAGASRFLACERSATFYAYDDLEYRSNFKKISHDNEVPDFCELNHGYIHDTMQRITYEGHTIVEDKCVRCHYKQAHEHKYISTNVPEYVSTTDLKSHMVVSPKRCRCGALQQPVRMEAQPHNWGKIETTTIVEGDCKNPGKAVKKSTCSDCNAVRYYTDNKVLTERWQISNTEITYSVPGPHKYVNHVCTICGDQNLHVGDILKDSKGHSYKVLDLAANTVEFTKTGAPKAASVSIPASFKVDGISYKVVSIASKAYRANKYLAKLTIPSSVKKIGAYAFYKCSSLKTITIKSTYLKSSTVGKGAFKSVHSRAVVKVPSSKLKAYKKLLKSKGISGKYQKIVKY